MEKALVRVWGWLGGRREVLHRRLIREGAGLCKKGRQTKKAIFSCCNRQKDACRSRAFEAMGVCLHVMQKKPTKQGAFIGLEEE